MVIISGSAKSILAGTNTIKQNRFEQKSKETAN